MINNMTNNKYKDMEAMDIVVDVRGFNGDKYLLSHRGSISDKRCVLRYKTFRLVGADGSLGEWQELQEMNPYEAMLEFDLERKQEILSYKITPAWFVMLWPNNIAQAEVINELKDLFDNNSGNPVRAVIRIHQPRVPSYSAGTVRKWTDERGQVWLQPVLSGTKVEVVESYSEITYKVMDETPVRVEDLIPHNQYFNNLNSVAVSDLRKRMSESISFMAAARELTREIKRDSNMTLAKAAKPEAQAPKLSIKENVKKLLDKSKTSQTPPMAEMEEEPFDMEIS